MVIPICIGFTTTSSTTTSTSMTSSYLWAFLMSFSRWLAWIVFRTHHVLVTRKVIILVLHNSKVSLMSFETSHNLFHHHLFYISKLFDRCNYFNKSYRGGSKKLQYPLFSPRDRIPSQYEIISWKKISHRFNVFHQNHFEASSQGL